MNFERGGVAKVKKSQLENIGFLLNRLNFDTLAPLYSPVETGSSEFGVWVEFENHMIFKTRVFGIYNCPPNLGIFMNYLRNTILNSELHPDDKIGLDQFRKLGIPWVEEADNVPSIKNNHSVQK